MNTYNFKDELAIANKAVPMAIKLMDDIFETSFEKSPKHLDLLGSDINNDGGIHIDIKLNNYKSTNYIIEWSAHNTKTGYEAIGNSVDPKKITNYILWVCTDKTLIIDYQKLRTKCIPNKEYLVNKYGTVKVGSGDWYAVISKVPMLNMGKYIIRELQATTNDMLGKSTNDWEKLANTL